jgi:signal transduction histidine kinase
MHFPRFLLLITGIATFCVCCSYSLRAQTPLLLDDPATEYRLDSYATVFIDSTNSLTFDSIIQPSFQNHFVRRGNLTFGYDRASIWLKVSFQNNTPKTKWYLDIPAPFLEFVDFYEQTDSGIRHSQSGYYRPQHIRELNHTAHVIPLTFGADGITTVYINITGLSPKTFPLCAIEKEAFVEKTRLEDIGYGVFFGILAVMFLYNLFIYLSLRQINYLLYILTIVGTFFIFSAASGYGGKYLWPEHPNFNFYAGRLSLGLQAIFVAIFTISFLNVKRYSTTMYYALLALIPLGIIANILVYTKVMISAGNNLITVGVILYMTAGIVCRIKGSKIATYFIAAWAIYLTGGLLLTLRNSGVFDFNFWTTHFVEIGAAMETTIIAFALGDLYRRYKQEKEAAQAHALNLQLNATETLEQKVRERTEQLSKTNEELQLTLETVQRQKEIIQHKNSELDAFFYRISHDLRGPVSSLLGLSTLAKREVTDPKALEYIDRQYQQTARLDHIIDGLINLTTLNHTDLPRQRIDFHKMIDECISSMNEMPNFSKLSFKTEISPELEFTCEWILLQAIFQNLIENSIKYSRGQDPYVNIRIYQEERWLKVEVEDNGHGIPKEHQHKVFNMFYRATQRANGTGLGLYILKRSVDRLQGTIEIKSEEGYGSTFTVKLPA